MKALIIIGFLLISNLLFSDLLNYKKVIKNNKGVDLYQRQDFEGSKIEFGENSIKNPQDGVLRYNLGNSAFKSGDYDRAINEYKTALNDKNLPIKSDVWQNLGNAFFEKQDYEKAIGCFKNSLIKDSGNEEARYNYEVTSKYLQREQEQQQQSGENEEGDENKDEKKEQEKQEKGEDENKEDEQKPQEGDEKKQNADEEQKMMDLEEKDKDEAEKILQALMQKEKQDLKEKNNRKAKSPKTGKYW